MSCQQQESFTGRNMVGFHGESFFFLTLGFTKNNFYMFAKMILQFSLSSLVCSCIVYLNRISMIAFRYVRYSSFFLCYP